MTCPQAIVLGAAGFIGRHTAKALAKKGYEVTGIGHGTWEATDASKYGIKNWISTDITLEELNKIQISGPIETVIHSAGSGSVTFSYSEPWLDFQRATVTTGAILEWIRKMKDQKPRLVLVSSAAVYGDQGNHDSTEKTIRSPISPYGFHKYSAEMLCESYNRSFGVEVSIVRLFSVYGEGLCKQLLWDAVNKFSNGQNEFLGTGSELRDWIHVEDAAELLTLAGTRSQSSFDIYNGGSEITTCKDILERLAKAYSKNCEILFNNILHNGNPHRLTSNNDYTKRILKWQPYILLNEGLLRYATWFSSLESNKQNDKKSSIKK